MKSNSHRPSIISRARRTFDPKEYSDVKAWVIKAIAEEEQWPGTPLWKNEPRAEYQYSERLRRIRFIRKYEQTNPILKTLADRLELCEPHNRCYSGACPECGRLFQRFYVRQTKRVIRDVITSNGRELIAICIIPSRPLVRHGQLSQFSITKFQRRIKSALDAADIKVGIGGIDFSFNEDRERQWRPFICPHIYLITSTDNADVLLKTLKAIFKKALK